MSSIPTQPGAAFDESPSAIEKAAYRKVSWRLIPFLLVCYIVA
jgi:hypothetical protein